MDNLCIHAVTEYNLSNVTDCGPVTLLKQDPLKITSFGIDFSKNFIMTVCSYHVAYAFQSESTLYSCLNVKNSLLETGAISEI